MSLLESIFKALAKASIGKNKFHFFKGKGDGNYVKSGPKSRGKQGETYLYWRDKK
jgi:hypothetical protein